MYRAPRFLSWVTPCVIIFFKGTVTPENDKNFKKIVLLLTKYGHVADVVMNLYSCAT